MIEECPHLSWSGYDGPTQEVGRISERWNCDQCGAIRIVINPGSLTVEDIEKVIHEAKIAALREVADEMDQMMLSFKHQGQWTRAGWAIGWVRHRADKLQKDGGDLDETVND